MSQVPYRIPQITRYGIPYFSEEQGLRVCGLTEGSRGTFRNVPQRSATFRNVPQRSVGGSKRIRLSIGNHCIRLWIVYTYDYGPLRWSQERSSIVCFDNVLLNKQCLFNGTKCPRN